jgi:hypothetical protein
MKVKLYYNLSFWIGLQSLSEREKKYILRKRKHSTVKNGNWHIIHHIQELNIWNALKVKLYYNLSFWIGLQSLSEREKKYILRKWKHSTVKNDNLP